MFKGNKQNKPSEDTWYSSMYYERHKYIELRK